jgi:PAS domain S-box-containing protein
MDPLDQEEELLRSVALQNAQSIRLARQNAEEELARAKEALEQKIQELGQSLAMMRATLESTTDGILVTDDQGMVTNFNEQFLTMWQVPREIMDSREHRQLLEVTRRRFKDPAAFLARIDDIYTSSPPESYDLLELADGKVFERFSRIQFVDGRNMGRVWSFRDITEHRRAQDALRKQSDLLRVTLSSIGDAVVTTDTEGRVLSLNSVAEDLTGWTEQEAQGRPLVKVFQIVDEQSRRPVENPAERALKEGRVVGLANHSILIARNGSETPIDDSAAPIRDHNGSIYGVVVIFRSIAERKRAEEAVRQSERELADFFENASVGLHWVGPDGIVLRVNKAELDLLSYARAEYLGHNIADFHADQGVIADIMNRVSKGETLQDYEARMRCKDGSIKHVLIDSSGWWQDGQFVHSRSFTRDITDRKRAEEVRARLAAIVEFSQDAIISKTLDSHIVSWNAAAQRLFGYTAEEVIGQPITVLIPPERLDEERFIIERLRRGEMVEHYETVRVTKDGRRIDVSLTISPIRDNASRIIGASKIVRDITARKQVEQRLITHASITHTLAESATLRDAAPKILEAICAHLGWQVGALWQVDEQEEELHCVELYHMPSVRVPKFEAVCRQLTFVRGIGLPGCVWASGELAWIRDVVNDNNFPRAPVANAEGLHGAVAFPIILNKRVLSVMEFFSHEICQPDDDLLQMMTAVGSQVGQFVDRKRAEEALRRWEHIFQQAGWPVAVADPADNTFQAVNPAFAALHGYAPEELIGKPWGQTIAPESLEELPKQVLVAHEKGDHVYESVHIRKDGSRFPCLTHVTAFKDGNGKVVFRAATFQDLTKIRAAEQAMRESEARFRQLADAMPQIVWAARPDGYIDYYNERWYEYTGFNRNQYGQASWEPILHPDEMQRCVDTYFGCIKDQRLYQIEYRFKDRKTGGFRWFLGRAVPVRDEAGRIVRWFGTCTDIDDTKKTEQITRFLADASAALAEVTDYESTLQKVAALAVPHFADWCAVDIQGADGSVRPLAVTHVDPAKIHLFHELDRQYPLRASEARGVRQVIRTGEPQWASSVSDEMLAELAPAEEQLDLIRELGLKSYISVPLKTRTHVFGALTFVTAESGRTYDIDDVRAAEDLAHRAVIAIENARLLATLKETDRRKDEFLAILAHELRNPLAPIRNAAQIFRAKAPPVAELQWATEVIDRQVRQMTSLVDDLLDVSRITRGKIDLRKERVELATIVSSAVEASRPLIEKWGHTLTVSIPPLPIHLKADQTRLAQVLLNLLNNAAKYMDQGGRIWLTAERQRDEVLIRIRDSGIGIPTEMLPRIFDMFTQVDHSLERSEGGLGIGLTLVQRLVEMHGGTVEARSEGPGKGSEFFVRLPIIREVDESVPAQIIEGVAKPAARRILIVDDNRDSADSLGMLLRMQGNEVYTAHDGLEAVGAAAAFQPDVVLLDIGLPKLNGYEAGRRIRDQEGGDGRLLVALTGWGQEEDRRRSKEAGFDHHLTKPVDFTVLQRLLAQANPRYSGGRTQR